MLLDQSGRNNDKRSVAIASVSDFDVPLKKSNSSALFELLAKELGIEVQLIGANMCVNV